MQHQENNKTEHRYFENFEKFINKTHHKEENTSTNEGEIQHAVTEDNHDEDGEHFWEEQEGGELGNRLSSQKVPEARSRINVQENLSKEIELKFASKEKRSSTIDAGQKCKCDEYSHFGHNIAELMRLLNNRKDVQLELKCKILRAIMLANELMSQVTK